MVCNKYFRNGMEELSIITVMGNGIMYSSRKQECLRFKQISRVETTTYKRETDIAILLFGKTITLHTHGIRYGQNDRR